LRFQDACAYWYKNCYQMGFVSLIDLYNYKSLIDLYKNCRTFFFFLTSKNLLKGHKPRHKAYQGGTNIQSTNRQSLQQNKQKEKDCSKKTTHQNCRTFNLQFAH
jgi:uncharacterized Fe-S cluster-containing protein